MWHLFADNAEAGEDKDPNTDILDGLEDDKEADSGIVTSGTNESTKSSSQGLLPVTFGHHDN